MKDFDRPQYDSGMAFMDMLFNYLLAFAMLFLIALQMVRPPTVADAKVNLRAEVVLTMTWPDGALDDIDLWLMLPNGRKVNFRDRNVEYATLERDDRGSKGDIHVDASGEPQLTRVNREMITLRALVPGRYVAAAHVYSVRSSVDESGRTFVADPPLPYDAVLEVAKLNPKVEEVVRSTVRLERRGQEAVFAAFTIDESGKVTDVELNPTHYQIVDAARPMGEDPQ